MRTILVAVLLASAAAAPAMAQDAAALEDYAAAQQRGLDQASNPAFLAAAAPHQASGDASAAASDPFRIDWAPARGDEQVVAFDNRYGARLHAVLRGPREQRGAAPAVVLLPGANGREEALRGMAQGLAEAGYVVLSVDPQGHGQSEAEPDPEFCRPGPWQEPQELGLREPGACAGKIGRRAPERVETAVQGTGLEDAGALADDGLFVAEGAVGNEPPSTVAAGYVPYRTLFVLTAFDAVAWLRSAANPWRDRIAPDRIGIAGHSVGADAAVQAANGDPSRFRAAVAWDTYGELLPTVRPSVPTMLQVAEQQTFIGPFRARPDATAWPSIEIGRAAREAGVPSMTVALRGSSHFEWTYAATPAGPLGASRLGERVGLHYTLAWFDRWLKPGRADRDDARARLLAERFDGSADRSSIGAGTASATGQNVPYKIQGLRTADHRSRLLPSAWSFDGARCDSTLAGC